MRGGGFFDGAQLLVEDALLESTKVYEIDGTSGFGLAIQNGASAEARRVSITDNGESEVIVQDATLLLEDAVLHDTRGRPDGANGRGIQTQVNAMLTMHRVAVERSREVGIQLTDGTMVSGEDVIVREMLSDDITGQTARGIGAESGSVVSLTRVSVTNVRELGIGAFSAGTQLMLSDLEVSDIQRAECPESVCPSSATTAGVGTYESGAIVAENFVVERSVLCGVQVADDGSLDLTTGEITDSELGACIQVEGYDLSRLTESVEYRDNGTSLDATSLPVPSPVNRLGS